MPSKHSFLLIISLAFSLSFQSRAQECQPGNLAFQAGESASYHIVYKWGLIWLEAGAVTFSVDTGQMWGRDVFHFTGEGGSYPKYDWIYKVRDKYESWADRTTLHPVKFKRKVNEGSRFFVEETLFTREKAYVLTNDPRHGLTKDTVNIPRCTFDPVTAMYFARSIDFSNRKVGEKVPLNMFVGQDFTPVYIRYMGREEFTMPDGTVHQTIKFKPLLIEGTIFKGGEHMTVWVTDDENRIPIYIESSILIGSVKAIITDYKGLKYPTELKVGK